VVALRSGGVVRGRVASCPGRCLVVCVGRGVCGVFFY
jgi:hypothetical protein